MFITEVDAEEATCQQTGNVAHGICSYCGKLFAEDNMTELTDVTVPVTAHSLEKVAEKAATEQEPGNIAHWKCTACGKLFADAEGKTELTEDSVKVLYVPAEKNNIGVIVGVAAAVVVLAVAAALVIKRRKK